MYPMCIDVLNVYLLFWFLPHQEIASVMVQTFEDLMASGDVDNGMYALFFCLRFQLFGGSNLFILSQSYAKSLTQMVI